MAFTEKAITLTFQLGLGNFGESGYDTIKVSGLRVRVTIVYSGTPSMGQAQISIYGLTMDMMNNLSTYTRTNKNSISVRHNLVIVEAGDNVSGMSVLFIGTIVMAMIDTNGIPDVVFNIVANAGYFQSAKTNSPLSYNGIVDVAQILKGIADQNNLKFENLSTVSVFLSKPYLQGSIGDQIQRVADAANINHTIDLGVLAIWPKGGSRGTEVIDVSPQTGMIGYPTIIDFGVNVKTLFDNNLRIGRQCKLTSSLKYANGIFNMFGVMHDIESQVPGGIWLTQFYATPIEPIEMSAP